MSQELITLLALGVIKLAKFISIVKNVNNELNPSKSAPQQGSRK